MRLRDRARMFICVVHFSAITKLDLEGETFHFNVKAHFRPNSVKSTYMSPQLEANHRIPVRLYAVSVGVEPPPCV
jgi:hypothetical protein